MQNSDANRKDGIRESVHFWLPLIVVGLCAAGFSAPVLSAPVDSCVACHGNDRFMVTNKKLYDYYQEWERSVHSQEGVSCEDCHGGDSSVADKSEAHGGDLSGATVGSAVNFQNIAETCGQCHDEIYDAFRKSHHFEHVRTSEEEAQGPTCVTCHGSINVEVLSVSTVAESCARCHNEKNDNHPENPDEARKILNRFLSIHRFYRYITARGSEGSAAFFKMVDRHIEDLAVTWHTFDLEEIDKKTRFVLDVLKTKRDEVRSRGAQK